MTELFLWTSQFGFTCAYVYFIKVNFAKIIKIIFDKDVNQNWIALGCWVVFTLLSFVRKIEKFAATHIFADVMILITLITVFIYGGREVKVNGDQIGTV